MTDSGFYHFVGLIVEIFRLDNGVDIFVGYQFLFNGFSDFFR